MEEIIKRMKERIGKFENEANDLEKEIEQKIEEWKRDAQKIFEVLCDEDNAEYCLEGDLMEDAESIQLLKDSLSTLRKEILPEAKIIEEWFIGESYVCAIEYDDLSGGDFDDSEIESIKDFQATMETFSPYGCLIWGEESEFEVDHISGLKANCLKAMMILV